MEKLKSFFKINRKSKLEELGTWEKLLAVAFVSCNTPYSDTQTVEAQKRENFKKILKISQTANDQQLRNLDLKNLLWSTLGLYCFFYLRYTALGSGLKARQQRQEFDKCESMYMDIVERLMSSQEEEIMEQILSFLATHKMWSKEFLAIKLLLNPLAAGVAGEVLVDQLLERVQSSSAKNVTESRQIVRVMYELLDYHFWPLLQETAAKAITRLLKMYRTGVCDPEHQYGSLRKGLEMSIRRVIEHLDNNDLMLVIAYMIEWVIDERISDEAILDFGTVLEHAAMVHVTKLFKDTFSHELFDYLMDIISSERRVISHLGNRILHQLIDRHDNRQEFETPRVFFQNTHFNIEVGEYFSEDKNFLKKHRQKIHNSLMTAVFNHSAHRINLESIYTTICLFATEIPCGYTAASLANVIMNIQEAARHNISFRTQMQYHLHALVMGVMSLLCWIHHAPDFYKYVNKIINIRAEQAPHLNPPLRVAYSFAQHHVLWDKAELFFEDWEVRYSLWMRFKIKDTHVYHLSKQKEINAQKPPFTVSTPSRRGKVRQYLPAQTQRYAISSLPEEDSTV